LDFFYFNFHDTPPNFVINHYFFFNLYVIFPRALAKYMKWINTVY